MPRTIDSLQPKPKQSNPKPVAEHKAGEVYRPKEGVADYGDKNAALAKNTFEDAKQASEKAATSKRLSKEASPETARRRLFYRLGTVVLIGALLIIGWQYWGRDFVALQSKDPDVKPVARVYDSYITETQLSEAVKDRQQMNTALYANKLDNNAEAQAYDELVLERALEQEAKARKIAVSDADVDAKITELKLSPTQIASEAERVGISLTAARRRYRIAVLEDKLAKYLLDTRDVRQYAVRWDYSQSYGTDIVSHQPEFDQYQTEMKEKLRQLVEAPLKQGKSVDEVLKNVDLNLDTTDADYRPADLLVRTIRNLNRQGDNAFQDGAKDWEAIEKLNKVDQYSAIVRSDGGYFAIYQLVNRNEGRFKSWDDFQAQAKKGAKKFAQAEFMSSRVVSESTLHNCAAEATGWKKLLSYVGIGRAQAINCGSNHWNVFKGRVINQFGTPISGASVNVVPRNYNATEYCGGKTSGTTYTDGAGNWDAGDGYSCFMQWAVVVTAPSCSPQYAIIRNPGTNNGTIDAGDVRLACTPDQQPLVAIESIDCDNDVIDGWAIDDAAGTQNVFGLFTYQPYQTSVTFTYGFTNSTTPLAAGEQCGALGCSFDDPGAQLKGPVGFDPVQFANNPWYPVQNPGAFPLDAQYPGSHRFRINGLLGKTVSGRNLKDGGVYSLFPGGFNRPGGPFGNGYGGGALATFQCNQKFDVKGDKSLDGAPANPTPDLVPGHVWLDTPANYTTGNPWALYGLRDSQNNKIGAEVLPTNDWEPYAYTICLNGDPACHPTQTRIYQTDFTLAANSVPSGVTPHVRWYYRPRAAAIKYTGLIENGATDLNPCTFAAGDYRRALCNTPQVSATYTGAAIGNLNYTYAQSGGPTTLAGGNNEASLNNLYPGSYSGSVTAIPAGWQLDTVSICDSGATNCVDGPPSSLATITTSPAAVKEVYLHFVPSFSTATSVSCSAVSGTLQGPGLNNVDVELKLETGGNVVSVGSQSLTGNNFAFSGSQLDPFRDGRAYKIIFVYTYDNLSGAAGSRSSTTVNYTDQTGTSYSCLNGAVCNSATAIGAIDVGNTNALTVKISTNNTGESFWKDYGLVGGPKFHLGVVNAAGAPDSSTWSTDGGTDLAAGDLVKPSDAHDFTVVVSIQPSVVVANAQVNLGFRMFSDNTPFGTTCSQTVTVRQSYGPWVRAQNGNVTALGVVANQLSLNASNTTSRGSRRGYGSAGTAGAKDDVNAEAQYLVLARGLYGVTSSNNFCSTNFYVLGRDDLTTTNAGKCDANSYTFRMSDTLLKALRRDDSTEVVYTKAAEVRGLASANCVLNAATSRAESVNGGDINGDALPSAKTGSGTVCPTYYRLNDTTLGSGAGVPVGGGRVTIIVDTSVTITSNIIATPGGVSFNVADLNGLNGIANLGIIVNGDINIAPGVTQIDASLYAVGSIKTCAGTGAYNPDLGIPPATPLNDPSTTTGSKDTAHANQAAACSKQLRIKGVAVAKKGFAFGRNYVDFAAIGGRIGTPVSNVNFDFAGQNDQYYGGPAEDVVGNGLLFLVPPPGFDALGDPDVSRARYNAGELAPRF